MKGKEKKQMRTYAYRPQKVKLCKIGPWHFYLSKEQVAIWILSTMCLSLFGMLWFASTVTDKAITTTNKMVKLANGLQKELDICTGITKSPAIQITPELERFFQGGGS